MYRLRHFVAPALLFVILSGSPVYAGEAGEPLKLNLAECLRLALENNLDLANAAREVRRAEIRVGIADGARLPEVELSATYTRMSDGSDSSSLVPGLDVPNAQADIAVSASIPLYTGGSLSAASNQARIGVNLAREDHRAALGDILLETATAFYELLAAQQQVLISEEALIVSRQHEKDIDALLHRGVVARIDLIRSQLDVSERERDLAVAETGKLLAAERLSVIMFPREARTVLADGAFPEPVQLDELETWHERTKELSPELRASSLAVELARSNLNSAGAERKGALSLFGTYGTSDEEFSVNEESGYWTSGINYTLPLYKGGRVRDSIRLENESLVQAENSRITTGRAVREVVTAAWSSARLGVIENFTAAKSVASAEENLRVVTLKYQQGLVANTDVIDAQLSVTRTRLSRTTALKNFNVHRTRLLRSAGSIEEMP